MQPCTALNHTVDSRIEPPARDKWSRTGLMGMDPYRDRHPVSFPDLPPHLPAFQMEQMDNPPDTQTARCGQMDDCFRIIADSVGLYCHNPLDHDNRTHRHRRHSWQNRLYIHTADANPHYQISQILHPAIPTQVTGRNYLCKHTTRIHTGNNFEPLYDLCNFAYRISGLIYVRLPIQSLP